MKYLESIRIVNFFLFEKQDIRLGEITAVFGPNGSGKSSLLDAVQIAMMGANTRLVALNAQADELTTTRSLRAYCLGQYGEAPEHRARDHATTYITLVWRDSTTNEPTSIGVCIRADGDREGHDVLGRYVLRGIELSMGDHLEIRDEQEFPRDWSTFRHALTEHAARAGQGDVLFADSQRYIRAVLLALKGSGDLASTEAFTRAFRFALRMRFDKAVDQIVRNDVLESRPTNIQKFRAVTDSFRHLSELVRQLEAKIKDGEGVAADFAKAAEESRKAVTWNALAQGAALEQARGELEAAVNKKREAKEALRNAEVEHDKAESAERHARSEAARFRTLKEAHRAHQEHGTLDASIAQETERAMAKSQDIRQNLGVMRRSLSEASRSRFLTSEASALASVTAVLDGLISRVDGLERGQLTKELRPVLKASAGAVNQLFKQRKAIEDQLAEAERSSRAATEAFERAKQGRAPLSPHVHRLVMELRDNGLAPRPVCDLVEITDSEWQPVIEAYLGPHVEALLITAAEEKDAFKVYRGLTGQRAIYGVKIVTDSRQDVGPGVDARSVAELVTGEHPAAVAYLRKQLRDLQRATTDNEALSGRRTLTKDGMLTAAGVVERLRPVPADRLRIGGGKGGPHEALQQEIKRWEREVARLTQESEDAKRLYDQLSPTASESTVLTYLEQAHDDMLAARASVASLLQRRNQTADNEYVALAEQEREWTAQADTLRSGLIAAVTLRTNAENRLQECEGEETAAARTTDLAEQAVERERSHAEYDADFAEKQWRILRERHASLDDMGSECRTQHYDADARSRKASAKGISSFATFGEKYREHFSPDVAADWRSAQSAIEVLLQRLKETELVSFREEMDEAYRASQETFRTDVAVALSNNVDWLDQTMDRLNKVLATCPTFTNGERYRFRREVRPHLKPLLQFVKDVATHGPTDDLFGGAGTIPEEFARLLEERSAAGAGGIPSALDDYREFFEFDIEILREDPVTKAPKRVGHLSKRLGPGSGGEHRAPLYVIAGAALASAYRLDKGGGDGMRLILLDEAFNKMDLNNIVATMRYLEELGLQVFMASPGENQGILTAFLHRYYEILRDPENQVVYMGGHEVTEATRLMFREDLPEWNEQLLEQEVETIRSQRKDAATAKEA